MSKGSRNFNHCQIKRIGISPQRDRDGDKEYIATVECPRSDGVIASSPSWETTYALKNLQTAVGNALCNRCVFANLTEVKANQVLAEQAGASAERLRAETDLRQAEIDHERIMKLGLEEVQAIEEKIISQLPQIG